MEHGRLSRAMAAALVNMAAKGYVKIEQSQDLVTVTQIATQTPSPLEPEEDALAWSLFKGYDQFDFAQATPQLTKACKAFETTLLNTECFSRHSGLAYPAWGVSGLAMLYVLFQGMGHSRVNVRALGMILVVTFSCFLVAVGTLYGPIEKIASRMPGSTVPRRPWTGSDFRPFAFLFGALAGVSALALITTSPTALFIGGFLAVNAFFYYALQGPTTKGSDLLAQLGDYRKFLSEVDADTISRANSCEEVPAQLDSKHAYAVAFHLDLGWGEQFVTSIDSVIESAQVFQNKTDDDA